MENLPNKKIKVSKLNSVDGLELIPVKLEHILISPDNHTFALIAADDKDIAIPLNSYEGSMLSFVFKGLHKNSHINTIHQLFVKFISDQNTKIESIYLESKVGDMIDDYKDFIQMHYLTGRQDTPFWKFVTNELKLSDKNQYLKNVSRFRTITSFDIQQSHGSAGYPLWCHILDNSGCYERDIIKTELKHYGKFDECISTINNFEKSYNKLKPDLVTNEELFKYLKI